jgi:hypothetical protein
MIEIKAPKLKIAYADRQSEEVNVLKMFVILVAAEER